MTRMSREFSLVLLGAGILTAGFFAAPSAEAEMEQKADEQAAKRVGHTAGHARIGHTIFWVHSPMYASGGRAPAMAHVSRGGFGMSGHAAGAGG